jgi:hypothetical protein
MSVVEQRDIYDTPDVRSETKVATTRVSIGPGQIIAFALGLALAIIGAITAARGTIDSSLNVPMVRTAGFDQSAMVGLAELGLGLLLILGALSYAARGLIVAVGVLMVAGGVVVGAAGPTLLNDLGTVNGTGWAIAVAGVIAIVAGCMGRFVHTRNRVETNESLR